MGPGLLTTVPEAQEERSLPALGRWVGSCQGQVSWQRGSRVTNLQVC